MESDESTEEVLQQMEELMHWHREQIGLLEAKLRELFPPVKASEKENPAPSQDGHRQCVN